ncbi:B3 domain-containing protein [Senna tora]|uniref:B3 domain-containing protein n=1 Tax=Senna tora TaxID=362788 RepID=A0A834T5I0_9FABA|nr:B3 domain-containing protein [Senna tora]KAF7815845.1 B3 domain-containing protein [Senna tora]
MPLEMKRKIEEMGGCEIKLLIQKQLFPTDLSPKHNRFSIPIKKISNEFLREEEKKVLETRVSGNNKLGGIKVKVVDPCLREYESLLKKWAMTSCSIYNLTHKWNAIVQDNQFQCNDAVQLWSFRLPTDDLCFALVKL